MPTHHAVERGIRTTAPTVTSAAAAMIAVFGYRRDAHTECATGGGEDARRRELLPPALARVTTSLSAEGKSAEKVPEAPSFPAGN